MTVILSVFAGCRRNIIFALSQVMQFMFFARHFAFSVICALGRRVSVQKSKLTEISDAIWGLCEPRTTSVVVLCHQYGKRRV